MQVDAEYQKLGLWKGLQHTYKFHGFRGLYSGWCITVLRAFPANAIVFTTFEYASAFWDTYLLAPSGPEATTTTATPAAAASPHHGTEHFAPSHPA